MFDSNDNMGLWEFKKRFGETRKQKGYTQEALAEALHFGDRSKIANWESKKGQTLLYIKDFIAVCKLWEVDPNYLLGVSDFESADIAAISSATGLSHSNIKRLQKDAYTGCFINFLLSSPEINELINRIRQICYYGFISEAQETSFSSNTLRKIEKAFSKFYHEVFPLDMNVDTFATYLKKEMPWNPAILSINDFIHAAITENEYNNILYVYPDFESKDDSEKYDILINNIAETSYDYMMCHSVVELSEHEVAKSLDNIVKGFINTEITRFKNRGRAALE